MKIQCELCREIVPIGDFVSSTDGIEIACEACGQSFFVPAPARRRGDRAGGTDEKGKECPKCGGAVAGEAEACPSCGLKVELFEEFSGAGEGDRDEPGAVSSELRAMWQQCEDDWEQSGVHDRFVEAASGAGAFAFAARCYRSALKRPETERVAAAQLGRVSRMAEAALLSRPPAGADADEPQPYRAVLWVLIVLVLAAGAFGVYLLLRAGEGG